MRGEFAPKKGFESSLSASPLANPATKAMVSDTTVVPIPDLSKSPETSAF